MTEMERALSLHIRQSLRPLPMETQRSGPRERTMASLESMAEPAGKVWMVRGSPWHMALAVPWVSAVRTWIWRSFERRTRASFTSGGIWPSTAMVPL